MNHLEFFRYHNRLIEFVYRGKSRKGVVMDLIPYHKKKRETDYVFIPHENVEEWRIASEEEREFLQKVIDIRYVSKAAEIMGEYKTKKRNKMENKKNELNTEQVELIDLISNFRKEHSSHLNVYDFAKWEHYLQKLEYALTTHGTDSNFYTQIGISIDGKTNYYKRYLTATDIVYMDECVKKINSLSSDSSKQNITFNIITQKHDHPVDDYSDIKKDDAVEIEVPVSNDYDVWHFVGDRQPEDAFMCIVKMFNEFSDTWTTGTGIFDNGKWEATDSSGESFPVRYWRRCPDFEVEGHYVGLKEDIAKIYTKNKDLNKTLNSIGNLKKIKQGNEECEDVITRALDFNLGDLVVLKSDATKVMTVSDVNSSYAVVCMFWSNDQLVEMEFPIYTIEKI